MKSRWLIWPALAAVAIPAWAQAPAGSEFQVNTHTTGYQGAPAVASDASGNFIVVWHAADQDGSSYGIRGRRYTSAGAPQSGGPGGINTYTTGNQLRPRVASDANGNFVVVWESSGQDGSGNGVFGQRYDASGVAQGGEFRVNAFTAGDQAAPAVASDASGGFVVVWMSDGQDGSSYGVRYRRYDAAGVAQGPGQAVNTYTTGDQFYPSVAMDASGNVVVVWRGAGAGDSDGVFAQRLDASGGPLGSEFRINSYTTGLQAGPSVASDASGNFVVVWNGNGQGDDAGLFGRRFDATGAPLGAEFLVNTYTTQTQIGVAVTSDANGNFVVVWQDNSGEDGSQYGIFGQRFNTAGARLGGEFRINSYTTSAQFGPDVTASPDGDFVVVWGGDGQDGDSSGVFGQRYGDLIFEDGFESADLSRWSSTAADTADLIVSGAAGQGGTIRGLEAFVNDTNALYVEDDTPVAESRYRARLYVDPNGFDPGEADSHFRTRIFIAQDQSSLRVITLVLKRQGGAYSIEGRVRLVDGTRADTGFLPITDGSHLFEFDWIRASAPGANNGSFTLWIDGTVASTLTALNNDANTVDFARMGAMSVKTAASGTLFFDQFESRRLRYIGPE